MSDNFIGLPTSGPGEKLDTELLTVGAESVNRERMQIAGAVAAEIARVLNSDPAAGDYGLVTREAGPVSPQISTGSDTNIVPLANATVDSAQLTASTTGKLLAFEACGTVAFKVQLQTVINNVATTRMTRFGRAGDVSWITPHKELITQVHDVGAGFDGFRLLFTNLDTGALATDFYGTFLWDEVL